MSIDKYFSRKYDSKNYNCAHLVSEAWLEITGKDISEALSGFTTGRESRRVIIPHFRTFTRLDGPLDPCIALFQSSGLAAHVGIYLRGRVLHISSTSGVRFDLLENVMPLANKIGFYTC